VSTTDHRQTRGRRLRARASRSAHLAGRRLLTGVVGRLPAGVVAPLRRPGDGSRGFAPVLNATRQVLRRGGLPRAVQTFTLPDNPSLRFVNADSLVLQQLYWFGEKGWEPELLPWWRYACRRSAAIVELGANVGYFAVQGGAAAPHARYIAVEPHPVSAQVCQENLALNGIRSVEVLAVAATADAASSAIDLIIPWEQLATPTVAFVAGAELPAEVAGGDRTAIRVPAIDVRPLIDGADVLKIDVEGQEHMLLTAGWEQLSRYRPMIFVEVLPGTPRLRGVLIRLCGELGYRCYIPTRDRLLPLAAERLATISLQREYGINDVLLSIDDLPTAVSELSG
jgi:FkbM family methyltransferase